MTCIIGLIDGDRRVWMGGDSAGIAGTNLIVRTNEKVFASGAFLFGAAGNIRVAQVVQFDFRPPEHPEGLCDLGYLSTLFVNELRDCLKRAGHATREHEQESTGSSYLLVGYRGSLYRIERDYQVGQNIAPFDSIGCGSTVALGAMDALQKVNLPPDRKIRLALEASERWNSAVRRPFIVKRLEVT